MSAPSLDTAKVEAGQRWLAPTALEPVRVMAVADGYAMVRHKGCVPFTLYTKTIIELYERVS